MAPHLSPAEQDLALSGLATGNTASQLFAMVAKERVARGMAMVNISELLART